ncbi:neuritin 1-like a [Salminus brasiliensis]|uniref:neuritin 1-like a n=1 Tax=Salminus brasiliensis TaxID=930266 RepID=UPI003B82F6AB
MTSLSSACFLLPVAFYLLLVPSPGSAAAAAWRCSIIYRGFAQCLLVLGDSLSVSSQKDDDKQEIDSICRSWDDFHECANIVMASCPEEAAAVWESLRQESKKMQFSGNLYDMCSSSTQSVPTTGAQNPDETNQESLKGRATHVILAHSALLLSCLCLLLLCPWI